MNIYEQLHLDSNQSTDELQQYINHLYTATIKKYNLFYDDPVKTQEIKELLQSIEEAINIFENECTRKKYDELLKQAGTYSTKLEYSQQHNNSYTKAPMQEVYDYKKDYIKEILGEDFEYYKNNTQIELETKDDKTFIEKAKEYTTVGILKAVMRKK